MSERKIKMKKGNVCRTDIPCKCGEQSIIITSSHVGYMGSRPCSEDYGECPGCGEKFWSNEIDERFSETQDE